MDPAQMAKRCPHSPQRGTGWLEGWRLTFGGEDVSWEGARATVVEDAAQRVFVVLYDVPETDEQALDRWDGATLDYYRKLRVRVETLDGEVVAWLYVLNAYEGGLPSAPNLGLLTDAAEQRGARADCAAELGTRPCASVDGCPRASAGTAAHASRKPMIDARSVAASSPCARSCSAGVP